MFAFFLNPVESFQEKSISLLHIGMNRYYFMRKNAALPLIELIIVIAILAILAAILIPNAIGYISTSQRQYDNNIHQIIRAYKTQRA